jgi:hypothetical protein
VTARVRVDATISFRPVYYIYYIYNAASGERTTLPSDAFAFVSPA